MYTPAEAARAILGCVRRLPTEHVELADALDRVLADDVTSPIDLPHWDNSAMDGYAARSSDLAGKPPIVLDVIDEIPAGAFPHHLLEPGQCARIFTGAPLPEGADSVVRQEDTTPLDATHVRIDATRDAGRNVRFRGEDIRRDTAVLRSGTPLGAAELGVLASVANTPVPVYRRPRVAFMGSGDEIADLDEREAILAGRKIASSNSYTLAALIRRAGAQPVNLGIARDDPHDLLAHLAGARGEGTGAAADLLVTSAGVSVGEHDYMHQVLDELGIEQKFWRIRMRPGAPVGFGIIRELGGLPWIGLPGNPVSTMVTFELFVRPAIRKMLGYAAPFRRTSPVRMAEPVKVGAALQHFLRVTLDPADGLPSARLTGAQGSGILTSMVKADALLVLPEGKKTAEAGEILRAIVLDDPAHVDEVPW